MSEYGEFISDLLFKADLVSVVSKYVSLTQKGSSFWGCCPFHHEKTPSMQVSPAKGMFYCYGCHTGGNAITFISKIENIEKYQAIKILAEMYGLQVPKSSNYEPNQEQIEKKKIRLTALMKEAGLKYHQNLFLPEAKHILDYLEKRQIGDTRLIRRFGLGYSLSGEDIINHLTYKGFTLAEMKEAGIVEQKADRYYDVFYKRLMFPIIDPMGSVVAFGGRILDQDGFAKYKNSPQTLLFDKSRVLYALNLVKKRKQREGLKYIIITEGYMDTIALHKSGLDMAVASMGTALTERQARLLKNYCDNVYISYDGDAAGQKNALRGLDILTEAGLKVKVIVLPDNMDPDDVINQRGRDGYIQLIKEALPLTAFKIESIRKKYDLSTPDGKSAFAAAAIDVVKKLETPIERAEYISMVQKISGYSKDVLSKQADLPEGEGTSIVPKTAFQVVPIGEKLDGAREEKNKIDKAVDFVLAQLAAEKPYISLAEDIYSLLEKDVDKRIYCLIASALREGKYSPGLLYAGVEPADEQRLSEITGYQFIRGDDAKKYHDCINLLKRNNIERRKAKLKEEYDNLNTTKERKNEILGEFKSLEVLYKQISG